MKIIKTLLFTLIALLLTGCYTQLQYSQKMNKITDRDKQEALRGQQQENNEVTESAEEYAAEEEYVPIHYKNYDYVNQYRDCKCNPYNVYNFYGSPYNWYDYHRPYFSYRSHFSLHHSYYFHDWYHHHSFGYPRFGITFSWGSPYFYHHRFYHDPFYYHYGYSPFAFNFYRFYGSGYGYYYSGKKVRDNSRNDNVKYGPRSIGTNRVDSSDDRVRDGNNSSATRTRSVGTARSQDTVNRSAVSRTRSQNNDTRSTSKTTRTRSRDNDNIERDNTRSVYIDRTDESLPVVIDRERYNAIQARSSAVSSRSSLVNSSDNSRDFRKVESVKLNDNERRRSTFFERMKAAFKHSSSRIITNSKRSGSSTVRSRSTSSSNRSSVGRSKSSSSRSSVSRSKSSSSNSRSRGGSSSSSRSRSGGDSGSDRSRGGN